MLPNPQGQPDSSTKGWEGGRRGKGTFETPKPPGFVAPGPQSLGHEAPGMALPSPATPTASVLPGTPALWEALRFVLCTGTKRTVDSIAAAPPRSGHVLPQR